VIVSQIIVDTLDGLKKSAKSPDARAYELVKISKYVLK